MAPDRTERHVLPRPGFGKSRSDSRSEVAEFLSGENRPLRFSGRILVHDANSQRRERVADGFARKLGRMIVRRRRCIILRLDLHPLIVGRPEHDYIARRVRGAGDRCNERQRTARYHKAASEAIAFSIIVLAEVARRSSIEKNRTDCNGRLFGFGPIVRRGFRLRVLGDQIQEGSQRMIDADHDRLVLRDQRRAG